VGVGEIFIVAGQSNSANHGERRQHPNSALVVAFSNGRWQPADDPQPGASGSGGSFLPAFGDKMAERFKVPIGLVSVGVGATSVRLAGARRGLTHKRVTTRPTIPARRNCAPRKDRSRQMALPLKVQTRMNSAQNFAMPRDAECTSTPRDSNVMVNFGPNAWLR